MRRACVAPWGGLGGLAVVLMSGCCLFPERGTVTERLKPFATPVAANTVVLDVAVLEAPPGDRHIDAELWESADEGAVPLDQKGRLDDNGLRVGVFGGMQRAALQRLLDSPRSNPDPHRWQTLSGTARQLAVGDNRPSLRFQLALGGTTKEVAFEGAQCVWQVTPTLTPAGVKLAFEPQLTHGSRVPWPQVTDAGGLSLAAQRPSEKYPALGFEVTLAESEYVAVGTRFERPNTYGGQCFAAPTAEKPVQRLVAIRARRMGDGGGEVGDVLGVAPPAVQARYSARGAGR